MPSSREAASSTPTTAGTAVSSQMLHGQTPGTAGAPIVVNDQVSGAASRFPARSTAALRVTVYRVPAASCCAGVNVAVRLAASYPRAAATGVPPGAVTDPAMLAGWTGSSKTTLGVAVRGTLVLSAGGAPTVATGGRVSAGAPVLKTTSTQ